VQVMEKELLISRLHRRSDSESSASKADGETAPHELERSVRDFSDRAPLIDSLQRELSSAQVLRHLLMLPLFVVFRVPGFLQLSLFQQFTVYWCGAVVQRVRRLGLRSTGQRLFTPMCLCHQAV